MWIETPVEHKLEERQERHRTTEAPQRQGCWHHLVQQNGNQPRGERQYTAGSHSEPPLGWICLQNAVSNAAAGLVACDCDTEREHTARYLVIFPCSQTEDTVGKAGVK